MNICRKHQSLQWENLAKHMKKTSTTLVECPLFTDPKKIRHYILNQPLSQKIFTNTFVSILFGHNIFLEFLPTIDPTFSSFSHHIFQDVHHQFQSFSGQASTCARSCGCVPSRSRRSNIVIAIFFFTITIYKLHSVCVCVLILIFLFVLLSYYYHDSWLWFVDVCVLQDLCLSGIPHAVGCQLGFRLAVCFFFFFRNS